MGSRSDYSVMKEAEDILSEFKVSYVTKILSAHRTPEDMLQFAKEAREEGFKVLIAGAGGAAHLPGMIAACTSLPVIGVPVPVGHLQGMDSLLSIVQMPKGVPVATVAIGQAANAGLLALQILSVDNSSLAKKLDAYKKAMADKVRKS
ncbi:MAG: 5-(carboxyamino)imidazole ribonucleotide mutase [Proteobacteria bacterium]|nr:5-(carboxyamino)imidazole ribonucleotide mutase [Pseudomonadota bacterium]